MVMNQIWKYAFINALLMALYILALTAFMHYVPNTVDKSGSFLVPALALMLLVFSVAFSGVTVFGRPLLWYLDGRKKDAVYLIVCTLVVLLVIILSLLSVILFTVSRV